MKEPKKRGIAEHGRKPMWQRIRGHQRAILLWAVLFLIVALGVAFGLDKDALAAIALIWGLSTQIFAAAFAFFVSYIGAVPLLGPLVVKVVTLPVFLVINGLSFLASLIGIKMGHKRRVFESRVAATILMVGILIGYILGKFI